MELVYLWVEDYKNIKNQGFNFSPRFECKYDEDRNELTIDKNDDYVSIFPDNINVTAIVGENGSGKSTIHEIINNAIFEIFDKFDKKTEEMFYDKCLYEYKNIILFLKEGKKIYSIVAGKTKNSYHIRTSLKHLELKTKSPFIYNKKEFDTRKLKLLFFNNTNFLDFTENHNSYIHHYYIAGKQGYRTEYDNLILQSNTTIGKNLRLSLLVKILFLLKIKKKYFSFLKSDFLFDSIFFKLDERQKKNIIKNYDEIIKEIDFRFINLNKEYYKNNKEKIIYLVEHSKDIINFDNLDDDIYYFIMLGFQYLNDEKECDLLTVEILSSSNNLSLNHLSSGEQTIIKSFVELFYTLEIAKINDENVILMIDEVELTLHPNVQKKFIYDLNKGLEQLSFHNSLQIIINSHSPFILSDLPKENVMFLKQGKQKYPFKDKQTFGANIHTLLSHGFFMKDGLMGEFAKDKIQSIIKYQEELLEKKLMNEENKIQREKEKEIYEKEYKTKFWQIQSIIGDDYLKQIIKNHLIEIEKIVLGNDEAKKEEVKRLKAQIELLEK
ncbi:MAG: ATP-binding protein [Arcobacteraceae bacterium]|nr:ATP-binding protein [Arcobacteraceae bacterium]